MNYSSRIIAGRFIICISMFFLCIIGMILAALITKLAFATLLWLVGDYFNITWSELIYAIKLGGVGGGILGGGWVIFFLFRGKGF
ncbi:hypothetical protein [Lelliottia sp. JS-SCA-14]|uniref:hypothetical protein n=1 Tax=Lelliottia sp. JS-SCA-14 TaxID=3110110 RepID=UPI002D788A07|nr:hypothetical protein [Lelliottia sp. JS-SCA-14]